MAVAALGGGRTGDRVLPVLAMGPATLVGQAEDRRQRREHVLRHDLHTDVEQLTDATGDTKATYGYTAFGNNDDSQAVGPELAE
jgi:hypothetical protein